MSDKIRIEILGTAELGEKLNRLGNFARGPRMRAILEATGQSYVLLAQRDVPKRSRLLKMAIHHKVEAFGTSFPELRVGVGGNGANYGHFVEVGTGPSVRLARRNRFMRWLQTGGTTVQVPAGMKGAKGQQVFARRVNHPGTKPQPFFWKHMAPMGSRMLRAIEAAMNEELSRGGQGLK